jgi:hypothetical protein
VTLTRLQAQALVQRLQRRELYSYCYEFTVPVEVSRSGRFSRPTPEDLVQLQRSDGTVSGGCGSMEGWEEGRAGALAAGCGGRGRGSADCLMHAFGDPSGSCYVHMVSA